MPISFKTQTGGFIGGGSEVIDLGSGIAMPTGIESYFEYNGVLFNQLDSIEKIRITEIGGLDDAEIRDQREVNPSNHGETAFNAFYGGRTITLTGRIEAFTLNKLRDMQMALKEIFAGLVELPFIIHTGDFNRDVYINCRKSASISMKESQGDFRFFRDFMVTLRASDPRFLSLNRYVNQAAAPSVVEVTNKGNFFCEPELHFVGPLTNLSLLNDATGQAIRLIGTVPDGQEYVLDIKNRTFKDLSGANHWSLLDISSDWLLIAPGTNNLTVTATGTTLESHVIVYSNDAYI